jgi:DNA (cytosine-5)-methyltransferase 1
VKPMALDLFCGAGGVSMGLNRAGYEVFGVDIAPQPHYPFAFAQADALRPPFDLSRFDLIWASPPCQAHVSLRWMHNAKKHADLIPATRALLAGSGRPYVIENVPGAKTLGTGLVLCGSMFGLGAEGAELRRHRHFETSFLVLTEPCKHRRGRVIGVYGGHGRDRRRLVNTRDFSTEARREAMGIDWMTGNELSQAIPPAYAEFIGRAALRDSCATSEQRL